MRRRLDLAASLVGRPRVLYLDEPTTGLDPRSRTDVWRMVRELVTDGVTVLLTTQYLDEADQMANDIVVIDHGTVIATGTPDELKASAGRQVLEVTPASRADLSAAAELLERLTGATPALVVESGKVSVQVEQGSGLPPIIRAFDDRSIELAEFALRRASLDEVFLTLTGHRAEEGRAEEETPEEAGKAGAAEAAALARELDRSSR
jgi:oleandomycin transport system ATP-binding protein